MPGGCATGRSNATCRGEVVEAEDEVAEGMVRRLLGELTESRDQRRRMRTAAIYLFCCRRGASSQD